MVERTDFGGRLEKRKGTSPTRTNAKPPAMTPICPGWKKGLPTMLQDPKKTHATPNQKHTGMKIRL
eukprot:gene22061-66991_t